MMRTMILLMALLVTGCSLPVHDVEDVYHPLKRIKQSPLRPGSWITTIGTTARVGNLEDWLKKHPPGSPIYHAILMHEREHTVRQLAYGLQDWLGRYLTEIDFMWDEESRGWYIQIQQYRQRGLQPYPEGIAKLLSSYRNFAGRMISYEDALKWVQDVLAGRWHPED
jgi:hypothetical protein